MAGLFGSKAAGDPVTAGDPAGPDRKKLLLVGGLGLILVAAFAVLVLPMLLGGSSSDSSTSPVTSSRRTNSAPAASPTPSAQPSDQFVLAPVSDHGDPFTPLPEEAAAAAATSASAVITVPGAGTPSTSATATDPASGTTPGSAGTTASATTSDNTPATGKPVEVITITGSKANLTIDGKAVTAATGQTPVPGYTVVSIADGKVTISHSGTSHILSVGELQTF